MELLRPKRIEAKTKLSANITYVQNGVNPYLAEFEPEEVFTDSQYREIQAALFPNGESVPKEEFLFGRTMIIWSAGSLTTRSRTRTARAFLHKKADAILSFLDRWRGFQFEGDSARLPSSAPAHVHVMARCSMSKQFWSTCRLRHLLLNYTCILL